MALCSFGHFYIACFLMHSITYEPCQVAYKKLLICHLTVYARVLKFLIWIPHEKITGAFFFISRICPFPELWPFEADIYFFHQNYAPSLSYAPLKKYGLNLGSKISQKLLKLEP